MRTWYVERHWTILSLNLFHFVQELTNPIPIILWALYRSENV